MIRFLSLILVVLSFTASAQQAKPMVFKEEIFDFGSVKEDGGPVVHEFIFTNTTSRPVKILDVKPSCGCTTPDWSKEPVAPGKTGFVQASYNPKGRPGYFNKTLTIITDNESNPVVLQIKGNVSTEGVGSEADFKTAFGSWKFKTGSFNMGKVYRKDESTVRDFPFLNTGTKPVTVSNVVAPAYIKVDVTPKAIAPGEKGHIKLVYNAKLKDQYGYQSDNIEIHTNDATMPVKSFTVLATLEDYFGDLKPEDYVKAPRLLSAQSSVDFGRLAKNTTVVREVSITNTGKKELQIKSVQPNCTCVSASVNKNTLKPGESTSLKISFNTQDRKSTQNKAVTIYSNDPQNPVQRVTFTAYIED